MDDRLVPQSSHLTRSSGYPICSHDITQKGRLPLEKIQQDNWILCLDWNDTLVYTIHMLSCQSTLLCPMEVRVCIWYKNRDPQCKCINSGIITMTMVEMVLYHSYHGLIVSSQVLWPGIKLLCQLVSLWSLFQVITWQLSCIPSWTFRQKWTQHNWQGRELKPFPFLARSRDMQAAIACGWIIASQWCHQ